MDVITIDSKVYRELVDKIDKIFRYIAGKEQKKEMYQSVLIGNDELAALLGISTRTLQRLRSKERIRYKIVYGKCCYDLMDIEQAIRDKTLYCSPKTFGELRNHFKIRSKAQ